MFFDETSPANLSLNGSTFVIGCQSVPLTANWDGGPETGTVDPGGLSIQKGVPFSVTPGIGRSQTYTLTVQGLSCFPGSTTHTITSLALAVGTPTVSDAGPCEGSAVIFSAPVSNVGTNPFFEWRRWNGSVAGERIATGNPSTPVVPDVNDSGDYVLGRLGRL